MHDALAYNRDTEIADVEDSGPIAIARVPTGELAMHVRLDDGWHRSDPSGLETACGEIVNVRLQLETRSERKLEHPLAPCECWTTRERAKAGDIYRQKFSKDYTP